MNLDPRALTPWVRWGKSESHTGEESRAKRESAQRVERAQRVGSTQLPEGVSEPSPPGPPGPPITQSLFSTADAACTAGSIVVTLVVATK